MRGALAALVVGVLLAGCGDGDTVILGGSTQLNNQDDFGATSVASNDLAPDGGAWSPDGTDVTNARVIFATDSVLSDGPSRVDGSAVVIATLGDGRTLVTTYDGQSLTPPVTLEAEDHAASSFDIGSATVQFLDLAGYENSVASPDVINAVRGNDRAILLVMVGSTAYDDPTLTVTSGSGSTSKRGIHKGIWHWLYWPRFRSLERVFADPTTCRVGSVTSPTSRLYQPPTNEFRFGWQVNAGQELSRHVQAGARPATSGARSGVTVSGVGTPNSPAADVLGFALVSDGFQSLQAFVGLNTTYVGGRHQVDVSSSPGSRSSAFAPGEAVSVLHLLFTQMVTSLDVGTTNVGDYLGGATTVLFHSGFNLATLTFDPIGRVDPPVALAGRTVDFGTTFVTYNTVALCAYTEATPQLNLTGSDPYAITAYESFLLKMVARQTAGGGSTVASVQDLATRTISTGVHRQFDASAAVGQEREYQSLTLQAASNGALTSQIFGRDEGLGETVIFFQSRDHTNTGGQEDAGTNVGNTDTAVYAALLSHTDATVAGFPGSSDGDLVTGVTNPLLISRHDADAFGGGAPGSVTELEDGCSTTSALISRDGRHVIVGYAQVEGASTTTSYTRRRTLRAVAYQTVRRGDAYIAFPGRFSAPFEVSDPASGAGSTTGANNGSATNSEPYLPVNGYQWQDFVGYRWGYQSDERVVWALWEQSAGTEDRLFARALSVTLPPGGPPTISSSSPTVEFDEQTSEQVPTTGKDVDANGSQDRAQVNFLDGTLVTGSTGGGTSTYASALSEVKYPLKRVQTCDLGPAGPGSTASAGGLLVCYAKTTDDSVPTLVAGVLTGDGDGKDAGVFANAVLVGASADLGRVAIDAGLNEDDIGSLVTTAATIFSLAPHGQTGGPPGTPSQLSSAVVYFTEPTQAASSSSNALYARVFDAARAFRAPSSTGSATDFVASFSPSASPASFSPPHRLDHGTGGNVQKAVQLTPVVSGTSSLIIFRADDHDWASGTADGLTFPASPVLVDQDVPQGVGDSAFYPLADDHDVVRDGIYIFFKKDLDGDYRVHFRTQKRSLP